MMEAAKEAKVKDAAAKDVTKATNYVSSAGTLSTDTAASTTASAFAGDSNSNSSVVGVAIAAAAAMEEYILLWTHLERRTEADAADL